jgi:glycosyltransferase involved in cell wall biosynthesis
MRILYFAAHQAWPLTSGNRLRDYHLARQLAKLARVTFLEMCHPGEGPSTLPADCGFEAIASLKRGFGYTPYKIARGMAGPLPLPVLNYFQARAAREVSSLLRKRPFATVQLEGVHLFNYVSALRAVPNCPPIVADWHNIESELMLRYAENAPNWMKKMAARRTATLLQNTETSFLEMCEAHTVASERERQRLVDFCPSANVAVIPNGVDTDFFSETYIFNVTASGAKPPNKRNILFVGSMDYHANIDAVVWFVREVWPDIARRHPDMEFVIAGRRPTAAVRELASDRIQVTGTVQDVRSYYASAACVVVPLRVGSGTRLKILEAMAAGVPIVATRLGAEGIDAAHDVHLLLGDSGPEIILAVDHILNSTETSLRFVTAARDLVVRCYDWVKLGKKLYEIHQNLAEND